jgi:hypothetical protein
MTSVRETWGTNGNRLPPVHFGVWVKGSDRFSNGPALCGAGYAHRTEQLQLVIGVLDQVTCKNCLRIAGARIAADNRATKEIESCISTS